MSNGLNNKTIILVVLTICLWGTAIYSNTFHGPFLFDDLPFIVNNSKIKDVSNISAIWNASNQPSRFVGFLSFAVNYHFHKLDVWGYHLVNLIIHLTNALLVWWLMRLTFLTPRLARDPVIKSKNLLSFFIAILFLVHPIQTQAVTYITQRFASLATLFYLLSICCYIRGRLGKRKILFFVCSAIAAILAMFTKEMALTLPLSIIVYEFLFFDRGKKFPLWGWGIIIAFLFIIPSIFSFNLNYIFSIEHPSSGSHVGDVINWKSYLLTQFRVIVTYIRLLFVPINQNLLYHFPASYSFFEMPVILSAVFLFIVALIAIKMLSRQVLISFGIAFFFITLLVESSIIPIRHVIFEHRVYLPSVGFCIFFTVWIFWLVRNRNVFIGFMSIVVLLFSYLTYQRNYVWQDEVRFWSDVVKKSPDQLKAHLNLGVALANAEEYAMAIETYTRLIKQKPNSAAYGNRGNVYNRMGYYDRAIDDYKKALAIKPNSARNHNSRGDAYYQLGQYKSALKDYTKAIELNSNYYLAYHNRAEIYLIQKRYDLAIENYNQAIEINPYFADAFGGRGGVYFLKGEYELAVKSYTDMLKLKPEHVSAYINRGSCYSSLNQYDLALSDYSRAIEIEPNKGQIYYNRGVLFSKMKDKQRAESDFKKAEDLGYYVVR